MSPLPLFLASRGFISNSLHDIVELLILLISSCIRNFLLWLTRMMFVSLKDTFSTMQHATTRPFEPQAFVWDVHNQLLRSCCGWNVRQTHPMESGANTKTSANWIFHTYVEMTF